MSHFTDANACNLWDLGFWTPVCPLCLVSHLWMAKTKKQCLAMQRTDLHAKAAAVPPPPKRMRKKGSEQDAVEPTPEPETPSLPPFDLTWGNMKMVMEYYKLSERDATQLLLQVVAPDPNGATFWSRYAERIKEEKDQQPVEPVTKKARIQPVVEPVMELPDNQLGDPQLRAEYEGSNITEPDDDPDFECEGEGEEEENIDGDPILPDEAVAPGVSRTNDDDDQESPNSGCVATTKEAVETVCRRQPEPLPEPTRESLVVDAAAKDAQESFAHQTAIGSVPTPLTRKSGRFFSKATRVEEPFDSPMVEGMLLVFDSSMFYICFNPRGKLCFDMSCLCTTSSLNLNMYGLAFTQGLALHWIMANNI